MSSPAAPAVSSRSTAAVPRPPAAPPRARRSGSVRGPALLLSRFLLLLEAEACSPVQFSLFLSKIFCSGCTCSRFQNIVNLQDTKGFRCSGAVARSPGRARAPHLQRGDREGQNRGRSRLPCGPPPLCPRPHARAGRAERLCPPTQRVLRPLRRSVRAMGFNKRFYQL